MLFSIRLASILPNNLLINDDIYVYSTIVIGLDFKNENYLCYICV